MQVVMNTVINAYHDPLRLNYLNVILHSHKVLLCPAGVSNKTDAEEEGFEEIHSS